MIITAASLSSTNTLLFQLTMGSLLISLTQIYLQSTYETSDSLSSSSTSASYSKMARHRTRKRKQKNAAKKATHRRPVFDESQRRNCRRRCASSKTYYSLNKTSSILCGSKKNDPPIFGSPAASWSAPGVLVLGVRFSGLQILCPIQQFA